MKRTMRRVWSILLVCALLCVAIPLGAMQVSAAVTLTEAQFAEKINAAKTAYPDGKYWNKYNGTDSEGIAKAGATMCTGYSYYTGASCQSKGYCGLGDSRGCTCACGQFHGYQCHGFANLMAYKVFGSYANSSGSGSSGLNSGAGWTYLTSVSEYYAGDFVRYKSGVASHSIFIHKVVGNTIYYVDCNGTGAPCQINWDATTTASSLNGKLIYVARMSGNTLKGTGSTSHTCNQNGEFVYFLKSHPHHDCYKCSVCGTVSAKTSTSRYYGYCDTCHENIAAGTYFIKNNSTGKYLCVADSTDANKQNILLADYSDASDKKYAFTAAATNQYKMRPLVSSSRLVNPFADTVVSGKNVNLYDDVNDSSQWWRFQKVSGGFVIRNVQNPICVLDVRDGWDAYVYTDSGAATQIWTLQNLVKYDANGGTGAPADQMKNYGSTLTLSSTKPTRGGYNFLGWSTSPTATSATYQAGGSYTANANTTLYAVWAIKTYTVSYNANGGSGAPSSQTKKHGSTLTLSSTVPTRGGYNFLGWSTDSTATSATYQAGGSYTTNAGATLYAVWAIKTYTVSYNANGGSGAPSSQTKKHGSTLTLSSTVPTRGGYNFLGWSTDSTATSATYQAGGSYTTNAGATLYAVWAIKTYTVSYNANGGTGAPSSQTKKHGSTLTLSSTVPTRGGYNFLGWSTDSTATSATYQASGSYTTNAGATLYAVWEKIPETVGDINADGSANMRDALLLYQAASGGAVLTEAQQAVADMNGDGVINMRDALALYRQVSA